MPRIIKPQAGPQEAFLGSSADVVFYGGAAGSGKSWALLLEAMRYPRTVAGFDGVLFRRTTMDIKKPGGLWSESLKLFPHAKGIPRTQALEWRWPDRGMIKMAHLEHDDTVYDWHGSQVPFIGFDEATTFTRKQFFYMLSRNRSTTGKRPYVRATCNADAGSWVASLIDWWLDPATGYPNPERSGVVRFMTRAPDDSISWHDTRRAAMKAMPGLPAEAVKSFTFIGAKLADNPALMRADPAYLGNLMLLPAVERERLLNGNWKIRPSAGLYFNRNWIRVVDIAPQVIQTARGWDLAATPATPENDPDYTTSTKIGRLMDGRFLIMDHTWMRDTPSQVERTVMNVSSQDGYATTVGLPQDPGQAGKAQIEAFVRMLAGFPIEYSPETGDKITRFSPFSAQAEAGNVLVLRGPWNERWFSILEGFPELPHDDDCDSTSRAFRLVAGDNLSVWARL